MNRILLTSLALLTLVNYNNNSVAIETTNIENMDVSGTANLNEADAYNITGTCSVSGNGVLTASKPVSIAGTLSITGNTSDVTFNGGLTVDSGKVYMDAANKLEGKQLHIGDNLTLIGAPTLTKVKAEMYTSNPNTNDKVTIKVSGLDDKIEDFTIEAVTNPDAEEGANAPNIYLDYNSSDLNLDTATKEDIITNKNTIQNTLTKLFQSPNGYLLKCDLSKYRIKDYAYGDADIASPTKGEGSEYSIPLVSANTLIDSAIRAYISSFNTAKQPIIENIAAPTEITSSETLATFFANTSQNKSGEVLSSWPDIVMPLSGTTGSNDTEIKLNLKSSTLPLKLSGGGITTILTLSGNNSDLSNGIELHSNLANVIFSSGNSVTSINYSNVTDNAVSMSFAEGFDGSLKAYTLNAAPIMNTNQALTMNIGAYSILNLGGENTYNVSKLNMSENCKLIVDEGSTLNI